MLFKADNGVCDRGNFRIRLPVPMKRKKLSRMPFFYLEIHIFLIFSNLLKCGAKSLRELDSEEPDLPSWHYSHSDPIVCIPSQPRLKFAISSRCGPLTLRTSFFLLWVWESIQVAQEVGRLPVDIGNTVIMKNEIIRGEMTSTKDMNENDVGVLKTFQISSETTDTTKTTLRNRSITI
jgi:hypothetical protein